MERKYESQEQAVNVAKEAMWRAWVACGGTSGSGFLQDNPDANKEAVWQQAYNRGDYSGEHEGDPKIIYADYVFGRMMKFGFRVDGAKIDQISDSQPRGDYQSWCRKYPTYAALIDAAEASLKVTAP